jgi:uncharacterized protein (DUF433 family)
METSNDALKPASRFSRGEFAMSLLVEAQPLPLVVDSDEVIRIGGTRVTLDTVIAAFREGMTAEAIVGQYPSLGLADVYLVIGYFLSHQAEVDAYLRGRQQLADEVHRQNEARFDPSGIRDRLLSRRNRG